MDKQLSQEAPRCLGWPWTGKARAQVPPSPKQQTTKKSLPIADSESPFQKKNQKKLDVHTSLYSHL
jgi:hypothetical protein